MGVVEWWTMAVMVAMVALVTIGVFFRYIVNASLSWYDEFASSLLVWLSFYGAVVATYRGRHIGFETLAERRGPGARRLLAVGRRGVPRALPGGVLADGDAGGPAGGDRAAVSVGGGPLGRNSMLR